MNKLEGYIPKDKRKNILLLSDDLRLHSGIATMSRAIVEGTAHRLNWVQLGAALKHHEEGKRFDLSEDINKRFGIEDSSVMVQPNTGYGDAIKVRNLITEFNIDAVKIISSSVVEIFLGYTQIFQLFLYFVLFTLTVIVNFLA